MTTGMHAEAKTAPRFLIFFPKGAESDAVREGLSAFRGAAKKEVELTDSLTWYDARFAACGNWDSWVQEAVTGQSYRHRRDYFDGFGGIGPPRVGQGAAKTLSLALSLGKPVYWLDGGKLLPVRGVTRGQDGWQILTGEER